MVTTDSARVSATGVEEFRIDGRVYEVIDGDLVVSTAAPVLTDPGLVVELADGLEDVPYQVSATDLVSGYSDPEGTELSVSNLTASAGTVTDNGDGTYTINPAPNFTGSVALNYDVVDSDGGAVAAARTFYLAAVNDVPVSVDDVLTVSEDSSPVLVDVLANDSDVDQDNLTVSSVETTGSGAVSTDGSQISYEPASNFHGTETISYTVDDGNGGTDTATLIVNVSSVNDVPVAVSDVLGVSEDASSVLIDVLANDTDEDNDALTVSAPVSDNGGTVSVVGNQISYQPAADFHGTETITYTLTDGNGGTDTGTVTVTVSSVNDAPTGQASAVLAGGTEDQAYVVSATDLLQGFSDVDGDTLSVSNLASSSGTVTDNLDGTFTINPALNDNGWVSLNYDVRDASGGSVAANQNFILDAVNDLPTGVVSAIIVNGTEDQAYVVSAGYLLGGLSDVEGDTLSVSNLVSSSGTVTDNGDGTYTINPAPNFNGFVTLSFEAVDGQGGAVAATRTFYVEAVNDAPVSVDDVLMVSEDSSSVLVDVLANDSDVDQDNLTVSSIETTGTGVVSSDGSQITYEPAPDFHGTETISYTVDDGNGGTATSTLTVNVSSVNDAPVAITDRLTISEDSGQVRIEVLSNDYDVDGDELRLQGSITNFFGQVDGVDVDGEAVISDDRRAILFTPDPDAHGLARLRYTVGDGDEMNSEADQQRCMSLLSRSTIQSSHVTTASLLVQSLARGMSSPLPRPSMSSATNGTLTVVVYRSLGPPLIREALWWWSRSTVLRIPRARSTSSPTNRRRDLSAPRP